MPALQEQQVGARTRADFEDDRGLDPRAGVGDDIDDMFALDASHLGRRSPADMAVGQHDLRIVGLPEDEFVEVGQLHPPANGVVRGGDGRRGPAL